MKTIEALERLGKAGYNYFKFRENDKEEFLKFFKKIKRVEIDISWNNMKNIYDVYFSKELEKYLIHIVEENILMGSEDADCIYDQYQISETNWKFVEKILQHWEDGKMKLRIYPLEMNRALYLLDVKKPKNSIRFSEYEYTDFDCEQPIDTEYIEPI